MTTTNKPLLVCDIDSTIWPAEKRYDSSAVALYGETFFTDGYDWYDVSHLVAKFGKNYARIFSHALDPEKVNERELYPGVATALEEACELGYEIRFHTHYHAPRSIRDSLHRWLSEELSVPFTLRVSTARVSKVDAVRKKGHIALVDDKPSTIGSSVAAGFWTATKLQPWNRKLVEENVKVKGFDHWSEFLPLLEEDGPHTVATR